LTRSDPAARPSHTATPSSTPSLAQGGTRGEVLAPDDPLTAKCLTWIADFGEALRPCVNGAYPAVPNAGMPEWETAYWGPNVDRLRTVKAKYDPENVFSFDQSLPLVSG
jgi:Berberine and berberine like